MDNLQQKSAGSFFSRIKEPRVLASILFIAVLIGIGLFSLYGKLKPSDKPADIYVYTNEDYEFSLELPKTFQYFQSQRSKSNDYTDIEILVPTSDKRHSQIAAGYGRPIIIRIYKKDAWDAIKDGEGDKAAFQYQGIKNDLVYTMQFWKNIPSDWTDKWNADAEKFIKEHFRFR